MTVRCIRTKADPEWGEVYQRLLENGHTEYEGLEVGREYIVYSVTVVDGLLGYRICESERYPESPKWRMANYFTVVDPRLSKYWLHAYWPGITLRDTIAAFSYRETIENMYHTDELTDLEPEAVEIWLRDKKLIEEEFGWSNGLPGEP